MPNIAEVLGLKPKPDYDKQFIQTLFYFIRELHINPLEEEYIVGDKVIIKKGMFIPLFYALIEQMNEHYKKEEAEINRIKMKHG